MDARLRAVKKSLKALAIVLGAVVLAMLVFLLDLLRFSGTFHAFNPGFAGTCAAVSTAGSSEDIEMDAAARHCLSIVPRSGQPGAA